MGGRPAADIRHLDAEEFSKQKLNCDIYIHHIKPPEKVDYAEVFCGNSYLLCVLRCR